MNLKMNAHLVYFPCKLFVSVAASIWPSLQEITYLEVLGAREMQIIIIIIIDFIFYSDSHY